MGDRGSVGIRDMDKRGVKRRAMEQDIGIKDNRIIQKRRRRCLILSQRWTFPLDVSREEGEEEEEREREKETERKRAREIQAQISTQTTTQTDTIPKPPYIIPLPNFAST